MELTQENVKQLFDYDKETGWLIWKIDRGNIYLKGKRAGSYHSKGYRVITIDKKNYKEHRLVWLYITGEWPKNQLDHINRKKDDNRVENLRECDTKENCQNRKKQSNNTSGYTGVNWSKSCNKWRVEICLNRKSRFMGLYENLDDAVSMYKEAKRKFHTFQQE